MNICVVGGGAAGMACAVTLSENGHRVTLIEQGKRVGKKLLSTGNGKCNLSNSDQTLSHYHGDGTLIRRVFEQVSQGDVIAFLTRLGIFTRNRNGYLYPYSEQASAVLDVLRFALVRLGVEIVTEESVTGIRPLEVSDHNIRKSGKRELVNIISGAENGLCSGGTGDTGKERRFDGTEKNKDGYAVDINRKIGFTVITDKRERSFDRVVIAAGSQAAPATGSDGSGYRLAKQLGHRIVKPLPALTFLRSDAPYCRQLAGIRFISEVSLFWTEESDRKLRLTDPERLTERNPGKAAKQGKSAERYPERLTGSQDPAEIPPERLLGKENGEVQFTETGISGIPVFQLSYLASKWLYENGERDISSDKKERAGKPSRKRKLFAALDVLPELTEEELVVFLKDRRDRLNGEGMRAQEFLIGLLPKNMALLFLKLSGIDLNRKLSQISDREISVLSGQIKVLTFPVTGTGSFDKAQVCTGGIAASELSGSLESKLVKGLYFAGEIIDVNGDCGGYNLTWAFATGMLAGQLKSG